MGTINLNIEPMIKQIKKDTFDTMTSLADEITQFERIQRQDIYNDLTQDFINMNTSMHQAVKQLDQKLNAINELKDKKIFIYHDSLKLYVTLEDKRFTKFEGRTLNVLSLLDRLYSANGIAGLTLPQQQILYNLIINIPQQALGHDTKLRGDVESYLGIFTGLLMFDDIQNMAQEAAQNATAKITYKYIDQVHLYLINEIYVPGSLLLSLIYDALKIATDHIQANQIATISISTGKADALITKYVTEHPYGSKTYNISHWYEQNEKIAAALKASLTFLKSFIQLLNTMQENFTKLL